MRKLYSEYPHLKAEILRLTKLDEQRKLLLNRPLNPAPEKAPTAISPEEHDASATNIVGAAGRAREALDPAPLQRGVIHSCNRRGHFPSNCRKGNVRSSEEALVVALEDFRFCCCGLQS